MNKRQYVALILANFVVYVVGAGALPLLPVYATQLGAPPTLTGYYLAFAYAAVTAGTLVCGWLSDRFGRRRALLGIAGVLAFPATWAMGRANSVWTLTLSTAVVWFLGGSGMALTSILAGILAPESERGKVYGLLSLAGGVGTLAGGLITGPLVDRGGYPAMFALLALFFVLWPLSAWLLRDKRVDRVIAGERRNTRQRPTAARGLHLGASFYLLFAANLVAALAAFTGTLAQSLRMNALGFAASAISSTAAVASALTLPLPLLIGGLSDRLGRKRFLVLGFLASCSGLVALSVSAALWHFWLAMVLVTISSTIRYSVGPALATDLIPHQSLGRGLGLFGATNWMGAILGFSGAGLAVQRLGLAPTLLGAALLPLTAIGLLALVRPPNGDETGASLGPAGPHSPAEA